MILYKSLALTDMAHLLRHKSNESPNVYEILRLYEKAISNAKENIDIMQMGYSKKQIDDLIDNNRKNILEIMKNIGTQQEEEKEFLEKIQ